MKHATGTFGSLSRNFGRYSNSREDLALRFVPMKNFASIVTTFCFLLISLSGSTPFEGTEVVADFFVATDGNDQWSGVLDRPNKNYTDGPFATLEKARDEVRKLKQREPEKDIMVLIRGGRYSLSETVVFSLEDAAGKGTTITYAAYPGEEPVFSSGVKIEGWQPYKERGWKLNQESVSELPEMAKAEVWVADVPEGLGTFRTLYDHERRLPRSRSQAYVVDDTHPSINDPYREFKFAEGTMKNWSNLRDVELIVRHMHFTITILSLESLDMENMTARTDIHNYGTLHTITAERPHAIAEGEPAVWVENTLEALDTPGEWVLDSENAKLYYWPYEDEPGEGIFAPGLTELIRVEGDIDFNGPEDKPVRGIVFRDLTFTQADRGKVLINDMSIQHDWEMIDKADALLRLRGAEDCVIEACKFYNSGGSAIRLDLHCQNNRVLKNEINHLGGAGILLIGYGPGTKDVNKKNEVRNNHIHHNGQIYWHSHGIVLWQSGENHVVHNTIHDMPRKGICVTGVRPQFFDPDDEFLMRAHPPFRENAPSIRWHEIQDSAACTERAASMPWGRVDVWEWPEITPYLHTRNNLVEYNEIYRVGEIMGDGSALNISGAGEGNIIRRNYLHDIYNPMLHSAIRIDDYQRGTLIEENVIFRTNTFCGALVKHENYWINNVIVDVTPNQYMIVGRRFVDGTRIERNILFEPGDKQQFYVFEPREGGGDERPGMYEYFHKCTVDNNLYFNGHAPDDHDWPLKGLQAQGHEKHGSYADPMFVDWENGDFRLRPESPARKMGIKSIDVREAGLRDDFPERFR
jgi:hypothetical protein